MLETIALFLLKIIGGAVVIYFLAAFIVSLKKILPFLSIVSSIILIILLYFLGNDTKYLFLIIIVSLFNQLCFQGEGFMGERIVENVYRVINVERRWNSLFADYDDYHIYLEPKYVGGFIENTIFVGVLFGVFYYFFGGSSIQYVIAVYVLLMSIVDLIYIFIYQPGGFITWAINVFCVLMSFLLSVYLVPTNDYKINVSYKDCEKYIVLDYSRSYKASYSWSASSQNGGHLFENLYFTYDNALKAGGYYENIEYAFDDFLIYDTIVYKDPRFDDKLVQFQNHYEHEVDFDFDCFVTEAGGLFKYKVVDETNPYESYMSFSKEVFDNCSFERMIENGQHKVQLKYQHQINDDSHYMVCYVVNTNKYYKPSSLESIDLDIYTKDYKYEYSYAPIYNQESYYDNVVYGETNLNKNFYYDHDEFEDMPLIRGYKYKEPEPEIETFGIKIDEILSNLEGKEDVITNYDFVLEETLYGGDPITYVYDSSVNIVAKYFARDYSKFKSAIESNDFETYRPSAYIFNDSYCFYNLYNQEEIYYSSDEFFKYTADNENATAIITKVFNCFVIKDEPEYRLVDDEIQVVFTCVNTTIADEFITYSFYFKKGNNNPYKAYIISHFGDYIYELTLFYNDKIGISLP